MNGLIAVANKQYIERLQRVIQRLHGADSKWLYSIPVLDTFEGEVVWEGTVERFELLNHPEAKYCYAWSDFDPQQEHLDAFLQVPPVKTAKDAVRMHIVASARH